MNEVREEREEGLSEAGETPEESVAQEAAPETGADEADESADAETEEAAETPTEEAPAGDNGAAAGSAAVEVEAKAEEKKDNLEWFVVHTYSGHEERAANNIERAVKQAALQEKVPRVLVPTESVAEMKNGKKTISDKKFFPSYVLVQMEMSDETWRVVSNTPGVTRFVGIGAKPQPISGDEIDRILGRIEGTKEKPTPTIPYDVGEHVKVTDGPFTDFTGVVDEVNPERGKLKVMVSIFGRATPVELDFLQVKSL
ncbi:MAG: transcription termination/antitermination protein NusG [Candidatus Eisenbacteria bacterium]